MTEKIVSANFDNPEAYKLEGYKKLGGYETISKILGKMKPEEVIEEVKKANLRGRGGAGFPAGIKWGFLPKNADVVYLAVNGDESEPGTFKDKYIMRDDPHQLIEGIIITCYAIKSNNAFIYLRGEYYRPYERLQGAVDEANAAGLLGKNIQGTGFDLDIRVYRGAGAYICGEETGMLESIEGKKGYPRPKPPFPAIEGLYGKPTIINNVETIADVVHVMRKGGEWFAGLGVEKDGGPRLFSISGKVKKPGVYELPTGTPLREIIYDHADGIIEDRQIKAVSPGGMSSPLLTPDQIDVPMDVASLAGLGSMLGSSAITVLDETDCMMKALKTTIDFFSHESCGQCTPCREGTGWMNRIIGRITAGKGKVQDLDLLHDICNKMQGRTICALADAAAMPVRSYVEKFRPELEDFIRSGRKLEGFFTANGGH